jgi:hypothetical protein
MKVIRFLLLILIPLASGATVAAEPTPAPTPMPPYVAPVPGAAHWIVTLKSKAAASPVGPSARPEAGPQRAPSTIETIKTGDTKEVTLSYDDGTSQRFDQVGFYFMTGSGSKTELFISNTVHPPYQFYTKGFLFFDTLDPSWFRGITKVGTVDCFYYNSGAVELWVAIDSMLPVAAKSGGILASFSFLPAPTSPIALPPNEQALLDRQIKAYNTFQSVR